MIFITTPFSYALISVVCFIAFVRSIDGRKTLTAIYFNRMFFWMFLYGLYISILSLMVMISKGGNLFLFGAPFGHFFILVSMFYGFLVFLHLVGIKKGIKSLFLTLYVMLGLSSIILNIIFPSIIIQKDFGYLFFDTNKLAGILWFIPVVLSILGLVFVFWRQSFKLVDVSARKKARILTAAFLLVIFGTPLRLFLPGIFFAVVSELSLVFGMAIAATQFFIKEAEN